MKRVLFICVRNSGRSQMGEAFFNRMAKGKAFAVSAGTQPASDIDPTVREAMAEVGIHMRGQKPKILTPGFFDHADRVVTMGCGVEDTCPASFVPAEDWGLEDPSGQPLEKVRQIRDQIKARVEQLVSEINQTEENRAVIS
ncbi:MAG: arsenate reductase ArsC [Dehalococcoidia bacterium]|nr:arsenate reductase ArsC [Dehalococcoidia bacterium]